MLFNNRLLKNAIDNFEIPAGYNFEQAEKIIKGWQIALKEHNLESTKETRIQSAFLTKFFNVILGYSEMTDNNSGEWHLINEAKTEFDGTKADGALGFFHNNTNENITRAVIELKDANTSLDKKQSSRKDYDTPISQAFSYSSKFDRCDWIIVSNFKEIRLYNKERGQGYYEKFDVISLDKPDEFKRFYYCLCKQNLIDKNRKSPLDELVKDTSRTEEEISNAFYKDFKLLRKNVFEHLCSNNPDIDKIILLEKTQKLLDRLVFIMFCEDSANLLPPRTLLNYYKIAKNLPLHSNAKVYDIIKGLFHSIDIGNDTINPKINSYNGGLFKSDPELDKLIIKDEIWGDIVKLSDYDFESDLNVNILGHIFEQSILDIEEIKAEIEGSARSKISKRKKDGIFYTPEYITRYIVEQTIGKYLDENPDKLAAIKILDPACGSGAFLNQAHSYLRERYKQANDEKVANAKSQNLNIFEHSNIAENDRSILLNNLFGVDLNKESVEITKLALWLKTAKCNEKLQNLDKNIKCGNSLIDDVDIAGDKAFNWNDEFKDIMAQGGFDVIIGNPPYLRLQGLKESRNNETTYFENYYVSATGRYDMYVLFIERAFKLLNPNGILCFILPNKFLNSNFGKGIRKFIADNKALSSIVHFGSETVFKDAATYTCILTLTKKSNNRVKFVQCSSKELFNINFSEYDNKIIDNDKWIFANNQEEHVINKILNAKYSINDIFIGIRQGIVTGDNKVFCLKNCVEFDDTVKGYSEAVNSTVTLEKEICRKMITGQDISKYNIKFNNLYIIYPYKDNNLLDEYSLKKSYPLCYEYLSSIKERLEKRGSVNMKYTSWYSLWNSRNSNNLNSIKIITPDICFGTDMTFDYSGQYYYNDTAYAFIKKPNCKFDYRYLISILNSKITWFFIKNTGTMLRGGYFRFKTSYLENFKFPSATQDQQQSLAQKAGQVIELNKQLHEEIQKSLNLIQNEYKPNKISKNLEKFYDLGLNMFIEELEKQKVKLSLIQKEELCDWYKQKSDKLNNIKHEIDTLDNAIDKEVYTLYNLADEEIKIIEDSTLYNNRTL